MVTNDLTRSFFLCTIFYVYTVVYTFILSYPKFKQVPTHMLVYTNTRLSVSFMFLNTASDCHQRPPPVPHLPPLLANPKTLLYVSG